MTTTSSIEETLDDWFDSYGIYVKTILIERKDQDGTLHYCQGVFKPCAFDAVEDGRLLMLAYQLGIAHQDERFENTHLSFPTDTTFKII